MFRVPHPTEISDWVATQHPDRSALTAEGSGRAGSSQAGRRPESSASHHSAAGGGPGPGGGGGGQFRPSLLASSYANESAYTESFDDVQEMEEALDR